MPAKKAAREEWTPERKAEMVERVLELMPEGYTLQQTCMKFGARPGTVRMWIARNEEWNREYQRLKPYLGAALAEEALRVARNSTSQTTATDRVLIETLKWAAGKAAPMEFGDRQVVQHEGAQELRIKVLEEGGAAVASISASASIVTPEKISGSEELPLLG
jgi:transposase-like protein